MRMRTVRAGPGAAGPYCGAMTVTRTIRSNAGVRVGALVQMLEEEGVQVDWDRRQEQRGIDYSTDIQQAIVTLTVMGAPAAIKVAVDRFRKRFPKATAEIVDEAEPEGQGH